MYYHGEYKEVPFSDLDIISGAGSIITNVLDYSKWLKAMIDCSGPMSKDGHIQLKTARTLMEMGLEVTLPFTGPMFYTLGWMSSVYKDHQFFYHSGGVEAFGAELIFFPDLKYGITVLGNTAGTSNIAGSLLMWHLGDEKLKIPKQERFDWNKR